MKLDQKVINKLQELLNEADTVLGTAREVRPSRGVIGIGGDFVDRQAAARWGVSCLGILGKFFGLDSDYYKHFNSLYKSMERPSQVKEAKGILEAAKRDYEQGFIQGV